MCAITGSVAGHDAPIREQATVERDLAGVAVAEPLRVLRDYRADIAGSNDSICLTQCSLMPMTASLADAS
jgi:hypothetical protein